MKTKPKTRQKKTSQTFVRRDIERFSIDLQPGGKYRIVSFGSRVYIGPMSLKAIGADPKMKTFNLSLEDCLIAKEELEALMDLKLKEQGK